MIRSNFDSSDSADDAKKGKAGSDGSNSQEAHSPNGGDSELQWRIRDWSGSLHPLSLESIFGAILEAMSQAQLGDADLAEELTAAVAHFIGDIHAGQSLDPLASDSQSENSTKSSLMSDADGQHILLELDEVENMIEKVLMETGQRDIARAYIIHRDKKQRLYRDCCESSQVNAPQKLAKLALGSLSAGANTESHSSSQVIPKTSPETSVATDGQEEAFNSKAEKGIAEPTLPSVESRHDGNSSPWDRIRIIEALIEEGDLESQDASEIAMCVEARVLRSGIQRISTSLLRELVDNELFERGFTGRLQRQASLALPKYDLERLLFRGGNPQQGQMPGDPLRTANQIGNLLLRQYALDEVFSDQVRQASFDGSISLQQLDRPLQLLRMPLDAAAIHFSIEDGRPDQGRLFRALLRKLSELSPLISEELQLVGLTRALFEERLHGILDASSAGRLWVRFLEDFRSMHEQSSHNPPLLVISIPFYPHYKASMQTDLFGVGVGPAEDHNWFAVESLRQALLEQGGPQSFRWCRLRIQLNTESFQDRRYMEALRGCINLLPVECELSFALNSNTPAQKSSLAENPLDRANQKLSELNSDMEALEATVEVSNTLKPIAGKVSINLPRIALRLRKRLQDEGEEHPPNANSWLERPDLKKALHRQLEMAVALVREAVRSRAQFLSRLAVHPDSPLSALSKILARPEALREGIESGQEQWQQENWLYALGIVGLEDAVQILTDHSMADCEDTHRLAVHWMDFLNDCLTNPPANMRHKAASTATTKHRREPELFLEESANRGSCKLFEKQDQESYLNSDLLDGRSSGGRPLGMSDTEAGQETRRSYCSGLRIDSWAPVDPVRRWELIVPFVKSTRLLDRLDEATQLRADGADILLAYLTEAVECLTLAQDESIQFQA